MLLFRELSPVCQMMLFSIKYNRVLMEFAQPIVNNAIVIKLFREIDNITQYYVRCQDQNEKYRVIQNIYGVIYPSGQAIIFCHVISFCFSYIDFLKFAK